MTLLLPWLVEGCFKTVMSGLPSRSRVQPGDMALFNNDGLPGSRSKHNVILVPRELIGSVLFLCQQFSPSLPRYVPFPQVIRALLAPTRRRDARPEDIEERRINDRS
jgi:hypothetical protein